MVGLTGANRCEKCQEKLPPTVPCIVSGAVAEFLDGGCRGKVPYPRACQNCRVTKSGCGFAGWPEEKKVRKSKARVEESEEESSEDEGDEGLLRRIAGGINSVDDDLVKMDASLAMVQTTVEGLTDRVLELDEAQIVESNWVRDRLLEVKRHQRKHDDMFFHLIRNSPGGQEALDGFEKKWAREDEEAAEKRRRREAKQREREQRAEAEAGTSKAGASGKGKEKEVSEVGTGGRD